MYHSQAGTPSESRKQAMARLSGNEENAYASRVVYRKPAMGTRVKSNKHQSKAALHREVKEDVKEILEENASTTVQDGAGDSSWPSLRNTNSIGRVAVATGGEDHECSEADQPMSEGSRDAYATEDDGRPSKIYHSRAGTPSQSRLAGIEENLPANSRRLSDASADNDDTLPVDSYIPVQNHKNSITILKDTYDSRMKKSRRSRRAKKAYVYG
eukprot:Lankesteria_metandrocarpae@DN5001_c0_g1_i3.p1